jgi:hypothetical protein
LKGKALQLSLECWWICELMYVLYTACQKQKSKSQCLPICSAAWPVTFLLEKIKYLLETELIGKRFYSIVKYLLQVTKLILFFK